MGLSRRIQRLEAMAQSRDANIGGDMLFDQGGNRVNAEILRMPESGRFGIALMPDGKKAPIKGGNAGQTVIMVGTGDDGKDS